MTVGVFLDIAKTRYVLAINRAWQVVAFSRPQDLGAGRRMFGISLWSSR